MCCYVRTANAPIGYAQNVGYDVELDLVIIDGTADTEWKT